MRKHPWILTIIVCLSVTAALSGIKFLQISKAMAFMETLATTEAYNTENVHFLPKQVKLFADGAIYSQLMQMRQDWRLSKNLLEDSEQRDALRSSSEHTKMLMNFLWHMGAVSLLALLVKLSLSPLKML